MTTTPSAYDMSDHWRIINITSGLLTGKLMVPRGRDTDTNIYVETVDAVLWDDPDHKTGTILAWGDITVRVRPAYAVNVPLRGKTWDATPEQVAAIEAAALAAVAAAEWPTL